MAKDLYRENAEDAAIAAVMSAGTVAIAGLLFLLLIAAHDD